MVNKILTEIVEPIREQFDSLQDNWMIERSPAGQYNWMIERSPAGEAIHTLLQIIDKIGPHVLHTWECIEDMDAAESGGDEVVCTCGLDQAMQEIEGLRE